MSYLIFQPHTAMIFTETNTWQPITLVKEKNNMSHERIIKTILNYFELPKEKVFSKSRKRELKDCRFFIFKFLKENTKLSLKDIGRLFPGESGNGYDHTSILHGIRTLNDLIDSDADIRNDYSRLCGLFDN